MNTLIDALRIGVALQISIEICAPDMISMVGRFPSLVCFIIQSFGSLIAYTDEEDDIDVRLAMLDRNLMIHSFRNLTLEDLQDEDERMEGSKLEYFPQYVHPNNEGRQDLIGKWMDSIECLDG